MVVMAPLAHWLTGSLAWTTPFHRGSIPQSIPQTLLPVGTTAEAQVAASAEVVAVEAQVAAVEAQVAASNWTSE